MKKFQVYGLLLAAFLLFQLNGTVYALNRLVPSAYPTIQAGINAAVNGDVVIVAPGTYTGLGNSDLDFLGKAISVVSQGGAATCIIDCAALGRGFWFHSGESSTSVVNGFTIRNGTGLAKGGGGILCEASLLGAASSPSILNCVITGNSSGGALTTGGGIKCERSSPVISGCHISLNTADSGGGGIASDLGSPRISNTIIESNSTLTMSGGGAAFDFGIPFIVNCLLFDNKALDPVAGTGGGISSSFSSLTILNCTLSRNVAAIGGGGLKAEGPPGPTVTNSILWGDLPDAIRDALLVAVVSYSDITQPAGIYPGLLNINANPLFTALRDFRLLPASPCIDAGNNAAPGLPAVDLRGSPRVVNGKNPPVGPAIVDMGAYEFP